jgi:hypothetical protein
MITSYPESPLVPRFVVKIPLYKCSDRHQTERNLSAEAVVRI